jgi:hypothetical protein
MKLYFQIPLSIAGLLFAYSCASTSKLPEGWTEEKLFQAACPRLLPKLEVKGEVWAKVQSPELSGQFPASVRIRAT